MKPRILIVGAQHGDERLGPRLRRFLLHNASDRFENVDYVCGNPRALRQNVRFVESDLNRSYDATLPQTYEQRRAQKILRHIAAGRYDYVLDVHTSRADVGRFFLATHLSGPTRQVVAASRFDRVAIMPPHIADCSLIGQVPQAISIEYDRRLARTQLALRECVELLENLSQGVSLPRKREIFYVDGQIPLTSDLGPSARNFERCQLGFYPIIYRPSGGSYSAHKGFAAHKKEVKII
jgi:hypothetical protein